MCELRRVVDIRKENQMLDLFPCLLLGTKCPIPMTLEDTPVPKPVEGTPFVPLPVEPGFLEEVVVTGEDIKDVTAFVVEDLPEDKVRY